MTRRLRRFLRRLADRITHERALLAGLALSILEATQGLTWRAAVPVAVGVVLRHFVSPWPPKAEKAGV